VGRRVVLLVVAFVIAAVGTGLVFVYVKQADDRALAGQQPVEVLVAKVQISSGTQVKDAAGQGAFRTVRIARSAVAAGALSTIDPIRESVALTTVFPGQQILSGMFGATSDQTSTSTLPLPDGTLAVSLQFADPSRVAGFVEPGSKVAVMLTLKGTDQPFGFTRVLLPSVQVVAVGPSTVSPVADDKQANKEELPRALLTLALGERDAAKVVWGSQHGELYLGLVNDKSKVSSETEINAGNVFK
jgi:pilus assembly protein CpaB